MRCALNRLEHYMTFPVDIMKFSGFALIDTASGQIQQPILFMRLSYSRANPDIVQLSDQKPYKSLSGSLAQLWSI